MARKTNTEDALHRVNEVELTLERDFYIVGNNIIKSSDSAVRIFKQFWNENLLNVQEQMSVMLLSQSNKVIGMYQHSKGGINSTIADVELIAAVAVKSLAKGVIIAHNHPSGNLLPSESDIKFSKELKSGLALFKIALLDSLIIISESDKYFSLFEEGKLEHGGMTKQVNLTNELRGEENDDYGTFEIYKRGGEVEVKIVNKDESFDKDRYKWLLSDYDNDGISNADDKNPYDENEKQKIDSPSLASGMDYLLKLKSTMDENMYSFVDELKKVAPNNSKIYARTKTPYSILNKLINKRLMNPKTGLTDLVGTTIVTSDKSELDSVKDAVQSGSMGRVIDFEDMYANPKQGYRAYHFLVERNGMPIELQLKTKRQKGLNELSHEPYKVNKLDGDKLIRMTEVADRADNGDQEAIKEYDEFMKQPDIENVFFLKNEMKKGGEVENENKEMLMNQIVELRHHVEEISKVVKSVKEVESWVIAKIERAATDLSDVTHYLEGENKEYAMYGTMTQTEAKYIIRDYNDQYIGTYDEDGLIEWAKEYAEQQGKSVYIDNAKDAKKFIESENVDGYEDYEVYNYAGEWEKGGYMEKGGILSFDELDEINKDLVKDKGFDVGDKIKFSIGEKGNMLFPYREIDKYKIIGFIEKGKNKELYVKTMPIKGVGEGTVIDYNSIIGKMASGGYMAKEGEIHWKKQKTQKINTREEAEKYIQGLKKNWGKAAKNFQVEKSGDKYVITYEFSLSDKMASGGYMAKGGMVRSVSDANKIKPEIFYKYEYKSKNDGDWKDLKKTDSPLLLYKSGYEIRLKERYQYILAKGGKVKFKDKVASIKKSLLERKKVPPAVQKDYGKLFNEEEADDSARRIAGSRLAKERMMQRRKK